MYCRDQQGICLPSPYPYPIFIRKLTLKIDWLRNRTYANVLSLLYVISTVMRKKCIGFMISAKKFKFSIIFQMFQVIFFCYSLFDLVQFFFITRIHFRPIVHRKMLRLSTQWDAQYFKYNQSTESHVYRDKKQIQSLSSQNEWVRQLINKDPFSVARREFEGKKRLRRNVRNISHGPK